MKNMSSKGFLFACVILGYNFYTDIPEPAEDSDIKRKRVRSRRIGDLGFLSVLARCVRKKETPLAMFKSMLSDFFLDRALFKSCLENTIQAKKLIIKQLKSERSSECRRLICVCLNNLESFGNFSYFTQEESLAFLSIFRIFPKYFKIIPTIISFDKRYNLPALITA